MSSPEPITTPLVRRRLKVTGIVQGVGFRPTVYRLARSMGLTGWVRNDGHGVTIEVQGEPAVLDAFPEALRSHAPGPSSIHDIVVLSCDPLHAEYEFIIDVSNGAMTADTMIAPDIATCPDCLAELMDAGNRRSGYAFLNCTNCGPRYTIVGQIPYDRPFTSMAAFEQCPACQAEYDDPSDRRFHAQPNACPVCGPRLSIIEGKTTLDVSDPVAHAQAALAAGRIVAMRGIGGFHLAVDPTNAQAVLRLRERKRRTDKPFALMARDLETIQQMARVSASEEALLSDPARPIVLLDRLAIRGNLTSGVAPGQTSLGFMLPYTPLHHLLLSGSLDVLVMTSANVAEEPITTTLSSATGSDRNVLSELADITLTHDREILQRCDDSVLRHGPAGPVMIRRSRGFVPSPIRLAHAVPVPMLAVGGHLKNTIALARGQDVVLSQHIGDLDNPSALRFFEDTIRHLSDLLQIEPELVVCDMHPEYLSTKWAHTSGLPLIPVQHHHAHFAAVLTEHGRTDPAIGVIMDGTGYGTDGTIWGGEILVGTSSSSERVAHLQPMQIPGGETAIREPWRLGAALLRRHVGSEWMQAPLPDSLAEHSHEELLLIDRMMERGINAPFTSSAGRLFDGIAALLGICKTITYEAQAAIELETLARSGEAVPWNGLSVRAGYSDRQICTDDLVKCLLRDVREGVRLEDIAARFHASLALKLTSAIVDIASTTGLTTCALSGGVFQNMLLLELMVSFLEAASMEIILPQSVPANDGGLAFGQIAAAAANASVLETAQPANTRIAHNTL
jgi:hydrogenase maturation protein HypF